MSVLDSEKREVMRFMPKGSETRMFGSGDSLGVPWILEPGGPVGVPLNDTCPIQDGLHENQTGQRQTT